jgi:hypothetical protein
MALSPAGILRNSLSHGAPWRGAFSRSRTIRRSMRAGVFCGHGCGARERSWRLWRECLFLHQRCSHLRAILGARSSSRAVGFTPRLHAAWTSLRRGANLIAANSHAAFLDFAIREYASGGQRDGRGSLGLAVSGGNIFTGNPAVALTVSCLPPRGAKAARTHSLLREPWVFPQHRRRGRQGLRSPAPYPGGQQRDFWIFPP